MTTIPPLSEDPGYVDYCRSYLKTKRVGLIHSPFLVFPHLLPNDRYQQIKELFQEGGNVECEFEAIGKRLIALRLFDQYSTIWAEALYSAIMLTRDLGMNARADCDPT